MILITRLLMEMYEINYSIAYREYGINYLIAYGAL
jgi:hypothetical protein